jgi:hypothetical protein
MRRHYTSYFTAEVSAKPNLFLRMKKNRALGYGHPVYTMYDQVTHSVDAPSIHRRINLPLKLPNLHTTTHITEEVLSETNK